MNVHFEQGLDQIKGAQRHATKPTLLHLPCSEISLPVDLGLSVTIPWVGMIQVDGYKHRNRHRLSVYGP